MHSHRCQAKLAVDLKSITNLVALRPGAGTDFFVSLKLSFHICEVEVITGSVT